MTVRGAALPVVTSFFEALGQGKVDDAFALLADDVRWTYHGPPDVIPFAGTYAGVAGVGEFFQRFGEVAEPIAMTPSSMAEADGVVFVRGVEHSRAKATGREYEVEWVHVIKVADGRFVSFDEFLDTAAVAAALVG